MKMFNDIALIRMVIGLLVEEYGWTYEEALDKFYNSNVCRGLSNRETGLFTAAPWELVMLFNEVG